eukprot:8653431-Pyramimonas_sp.AAC.1
MRGGQRSVPPDVGCPGPGHTNNFCGVGRMSWERTGAPGYRSGRRERGSSGGGRMWEGLLVSLKLQPEGG